MAHLYNAGPIECEIDIKGHVPTCSCHKALGVPLPVDAEYCYGDKIMDAAEFERLQDSWVDLYKLLLRQKFRSKVREDNRNLLSTMSRDEVEQFMLDRELGCQSILNFYYRIARVFITGIGEWRTNKADHQQGDVEGKLADQTEIVQSPVSESRSGGGSTFLEGLTRTLEDLGGRRGMSYQNASSIAGETVLDGSSDRGPKNLLAQQRKVIHCNPNSRQWEVASRTHGYKLPKTITCRVSYELVTRYKDDPTPTSLSVEISSQTATSASVRKFGTVDPNFPSVHEAASQISPTHSAQSFIPPTSTSDQWSRFDLIVFPSSFTELTVSTVSTAVPGQSAPTPTNTPIKYPNSKMNHVELRKRDILDQSEVVEINHNEASKITSTVQVLTPSIGPVTIHPDVQSGQISEAKPVVRRDYWDAYWEWLDRVEADRDKYLSQERQTLREAYQLQRPGGRSLKEARLQDYSPFQWVLDRKFADRNMPNEVDCGLDHRTDPRNTPCNPSPVLSTHPQISAGSIINPITGPVVVGIIILLIMFFALPLFRCGGPAPADNTEVLELPPDSDNDDDDETNDYQYSEYDDGLDADLQLARWSTLFTRDQWPGIEDDLRRSGLHIPDYDSCYVNDREYWRGGDDWA
ncbi:hypothetical protein ONS95_006026 [Cadophora gregata]|uniref:uncharacterized protein n=1 Tax=Cadophora gregata TaxID=51156 RepID=UPI0026DDC171|nr:uncharacterized protein ONS95_006026 [Cadophora gregata]KAK0102406.1 hypothetical protein ONS95_006026 [Cadophora gregata]KAK0104030.1 hypothetical protein ONS96_005135 [Cadophora gregata f. sp. sojae]